LREFLETVTALNFDTGDELFSNFHCTLQSAAKDDWDLIITNIPNRTPVLFFAAIEEWKRELILPSICQTMVDCLETLSKPCNMMVEAFFDHLKVMVHYINDIPFSGHNPPSVNPTKLKNIIFRAPCL
jgi:hypothetical protein